MEQNKRVSKLSVVKTELETSISQVKIERELLEKSLFKIKDKLNALEARRIALTYSVSLINKANNKKQ